MMQSYFRAEKHFTALSFTRRRILVSACCLGQLLTASAVLAQDTEQVPGFTEPYRRIQVACSETGIVATVDVRVGQRVEGGQTLATLESSEHRALLELAEHQMAAQGRLEAAMAEARLRQARLENVTELAAQGYANGEELQRAQMESEVADAHVQSAREDLVARALECRKIQAQLANRMVHAPQNGVVVEILKKPGEFVSYNDPNVCVLVELDRLLATFCVPEERAASLKVGQTLRLRFGAQPQLADGTIEVISPVTDAESSTVRLQLLLENLDGRHRAGERCTLELSP
jgi:RND family efflux transporter MFP subunit